MSINVAIAVVAFSSYVAQVYWWRQVLTPQHRRQVEQATHNGSLCPRTRPLCFRPLCCCFYFNFRLFSHDFHFNLNRANISWRINFYSGEKQLNCLVMFVYWGASTTLERNFGSHESCDNSISLYLSCKLFSEQIARTSRDYVLWNFISWHKRIFSHRYLTLKFCGFSRFLRTLLIKWNILYA